MMKLHPSTFGAKAKSSRKAFGPGGRRRTVSRKHGKTSARKQFATKALAYHDRPCTLSTVLLSLSAPRLQETGTYLRRLRRHRDLTIFPPGPQAHEGDFGKIDDNEERAIKSLADHASRMAAEKCSWDNI